MQHLALPGCLINIEQPSNQAFQAMAAVFSWHIHRLYTVGIANQTARSEHTENSRDNKGSITFKYKGQFICIYCATDEFKSIHSFYITHGVWNKPNAYSSLQLMCFAKGQQFQIISKIRPLPELNPKLSRVQGVQLFYALRCGVAFNSIDFELLTCEPMMWTHCLH